MPPRYAYWTILIDNKPTAFRARDKEELAPTLAQLRRTNSDVVMRWFARGKLWDSPEQAQWASKNLPTPGEKRGRDWRPGGQHKDPRDRFKKKNRPDRAARSRPASDARGGAKSQPTGDWRPHPAAKKPFAARGEQRSRSAPRGDRPWRDQPRGKGTRPVRPKGERPTRRSVPPERREGEPPPSPPARTEQPDSPPRPEQIVTKPEPPERG